MANLNEYCLQRIFANLTTPIEWCHVSHVCKLWKTAASKQWENITEIKYSAHKACFQDEKIIDLTPKVIPVDLVEKMVFFAAPFVKALFAISYDKKVTYIQFGSFLYQTKYFNPENFLAILAEKSTEICKVFFGSWVPEVELVKPLFEINKVKKVTFFNSGYYTAVPTDGIEDVDATFFNIDEFKSFEGHFPDLKNLSLTVNFDNGNKLKSKLSPVLSNVLGLKTLNLSISAENSCEVSNNIFLDITKLSELEELKLQIYDVSVECVDVFLNQLKVCCPKLRVVRLDSVEVTKDTLKSLLTLPHLEKFAFTTKLSDIFPSPKKLPQLQNLTELCIVFFCDQLKISALCRVIAKMPNLKNLELHIFKLDGQIHFGEIVLLISKLAEAAALYGKDLLVLKVDPPECLGLKIKKINSVEAAANVKEKYLILELWYDDSLELWRLKSEEVQDAVQGKLQNHHVYLLDE